MNRPPVVVVGAGSWGTALAIHLAAAGPVRLWCRPEDGPAEIAGWRENRTFLPGITIPERVLISGDLPGLLEGAALTVLAVPTQHLSRFLTQNRSLAWPSGPVVLVAKGIEVGTLRFPNQILAEALGPEVVDRTVVMCGPSFAREVALGEPTAVVAAGPGPEAETCQHYFSHNHFRVYTSPDQIGVEVAAALKNVVAIAAGVADGLGFGSNAAGALVTRALAEISRLGISLGAHRETFMGLAGIGDLVLTCTGRLSRNRQVGQHLGRGRSLQEILSEMKMVAEGVETCRAARALGERQGVPMPIVEQVYQILFEQKDPRRALDELFARRLRPEPEADSR